MTRYTALEIKSLMQKTGFTSTSLVEKGQRIFYAKASFCILKPK